MSDNQSRGTLVVVPCGGQKVWRSAPQTGSVPARDAYVSPYFKLNRAYAEAFGDRWVILSAGYDFLDPEECIRNYDVSFNSPSSKPIGIDRLVEQARELHFERYGEILGLGGKSYRRILLDVALALTCRVVFPFAGLTGIGYIQSATKHAIQDGSPYLAQRPQPGLKESRQR